MEHCHLIQEHIHEDRSKVDITDGMYFQTKNLNYDLFLNALVWNLLVYYMAICCTYVCYEHLFIFRNGKKFGFGGVVQVVAIVYD
jgi:hypothetical protein